jgi:hypothetical protein
MKKYIIILLSLLSAFSVQGQSNSANSTFTNNHYVPLKMFNGDTLAYIQHNFIDNKEKYLCKNLNTLFKDLEIPIKSCWSGENYNNPVVPSVDFDFYTSKKVPKLRKRISIIVFLCPPVPEDSLSVLLWDMTESKRIYLGKQTIGNIMVNKWNLDN